MILTLPTILICVAIRICATPRSSKATDAGSRRWRWRRCWRRCWCWRWRWATTALCWLLALDDLPLYLQIPHTESGRIKIAALGTTIRDPTCPLRTFDDTPMAPQHVAGVTLSVTRWIWIVGIGFIAIHFDAKPPIILKFSTNMELVPDIHLGIATILVTTTVLIWPCVPCCLRMATATDFDNIQFHASRA